MKAKEEIRLELKQELGIKKLRSSKQKGKRRRKLGRLTEGLSPELEHMPAAVKSHKRPQESSTKQQTSRKVIPAVPTVSVVPNYAPVYQNRSAQPDSSEPHPQLAAD